MMDIASSLRWIVLHAEELNGILNPTSTENASHKRVFVQKEESSFKKILKYRLCNICGKLIL